MDLVVRNANLSFYDLFQLRCFVDHCADTLLRGNRFLLIRWAYGIMQKTFFHSVAAGISSILIHHLTLCGKRQPFYEPQRLRTIHL